VPTAVVCRLTRGQVTVALSGDGGDELFSGYTRFVQGQAFWRHLQRIPAPLRRAAGTLLRTLPVGAGDAIGRALPRGLGGAAVGRRINRLGAVLADGTFPGLYREMIGLWTAVPVLDPPEEEAPPPALPPDLAPLDHMRLFDTLAYLPDDILTKVDRASMAVSLEVRVPLLDHRVVAFAWSLPPALNGAEDRGKRMLRRVLYRRVPRQLIERPKRGFAPPVAAWLRGPLRDWAEELLAPARLAEGGIDPALIRPLWDRHLSGAANEQYRLWAVLMHEAWRRRWLGAG
jgi:asparagine synthase (glutamine-hydrolysing)